jgi:hypothetical protein
MLVLLIEGIYEVCGFDDFMGTIYLPGFMKTGISLQAILRFGLRNLGGRDICINDRVGYMN